MPLPCWLMRMMSCSPRVIFTQPRLSPGSRLTAISPLGRTLANAPNSTRLIRPLRVIMIRYFPSAKSWTGSAAVIFSSGDRGNTFISDWPLAVRSNSGIS